MTTIDLGDEEETENKEEEETLVRNR